MPPSYEDQRLIEAIISKMLRDARLRYSHTFVADAGTFLNFKDWRDESHYAIIWINETGHRLSMEMGVRQHSQLSHAWEESFDLGPLSDISTSLARAMMLLKESFDR